MATLKDKLKDLKDKVMKTRQIDLTSVKRAEKAMTEAAKQGKTHSE